MSHSTITNSRIIPCLIFLKTKLQSDINDGNDLKEMKAFMFICLNYYIVKYNMFNNVVLISATFLDPELKSFDFVKQLTDKTADEFQLIAIDFLKEKHQEISPEDSTETALDKETSGSKKTNVSLENELFSFLNPNTQKQTSSKKSDLSIQEEINLYNTLSITKSDFYLF